MRVPPCSAPSSAVVSRAECRAGDPVRHESPGGGVRAAVTATTRVAPAARSAAAAAASVAPVVATSSTRSTDEPTRPRAEKRGPTRRSLTESPVCAGPGRRTRRRHSGRRARRATRRARSSAWSNPRSRRCSADVGAQVTVAGSGGPRSGAMASASQRVAAWARRYFTRATSSRATPSYANAAAHASTPAGAGANGAGRSVAAQRGQTGSAGRPHPGQARGSRPAIMRRR